MLKEVSGMEKKILLSSCETDYNSDLHSWIDIERQIKNLADAGFTHTQWMQNWEGEYLNVPDQRCVKRLWNSCT